MKFHLTCCVLSLNNINYLLLEKLLIAAIAIENWKYASSLCFFTVVTLTLLIMQITLLNSDGEGFFQHIYNRNWNFLSLKCLPLTRHLKFGKRKHTGKVTYWVSLHVILTCISARQKKTMLYFPNFQAFRKFDLCGLQDHDYTDRKLISALYWNVALHYTA